MKHSRFAATIRTESSHRTRRGFTIVELLIVIVVIAILAAITIVAYNGIQQRARDASRKQAVAQILKGLELYYTDKGTYPTTSSDSTSSTFLQELQPYMSSVPADPTNTGSYIISYRYDGPGYIYNGSTGCKSGDYLATGMWVLSVTFESSADSPFPVGSGAIATDQTRCGTSKAFVSTSTKTYYFSPQVQRS